MPFTGQVAQIPVGQQGFTGIINQSQAGPGHLIATNGVELEAGIVRKEGGAVKINAVALDGGARIMSGIQWSPVPGTLHELVFLTTGKVLRDAGSGAFSTTLRTGLVNTPEPPPYFCSGGGETVAAQRKLFMFSMNNKVQVVSGVSGVMLDLASPPADWAATFPRFGCSHALRMFAGGNISDPHRLYYTPVSNHEDYTGAGSGSLPIYPGEGEGLVAAYSFSGFLILWKYPLGVYAVNTSDPNPVNWSVSKISLAVGGVNQHMLIPIDNDILFWDRIGNLHSLKRTTFAGDMNTSNIAAGSNIDQFMRTDINLSKMKRGVGIWYPARRQAITALPRGTNSDNDLRLIAEIRDVVDPTGQVQKALRFFKSDRDVCPSMWLAEDAFGIARPRIGDDVGFVWRIDADARNKDGAGYAMVASTAEMDLSHVDPSLAWKRKNFEWLSIVSEPSGSFDLAVNVYVDGKLVATPVFNLGGSGAVIGEFILGTDALAEAVTKLEKRRIGTQGNRIRIEFSNGGADETVSLANFYVGYTVADEGGSPR